MLNKFLGRFRYILLLLTFLLLLSRKCCRLLLKKLSLVQTIVLAVQMSHFVVPIIFPPTESTQITVCRQTKNMQKCGTNLTIAMFAIHSGDSEDISCNLPGDRIPTPLGFQAVLPLSRPDALVSTEISIQPRRR